MDLSRYKAKARDSFTTKKNLFIFNQVINNGKIGKDEFNSFTISEGLIHLYSNVYWQYNREHKINEKTLDQIYQDMLQIKKDHEAMFNQLCMEYISNFKNVLPLNDYEKLDACTKCEYCDITLDQINQLADLHKLYKKTDRGWRLEVDRKNSNKEYTPDNCVMACYWCNNAKTDEFTHSEFKEIGKAIKKVWEQRLNDNRPTNQ